MTNDPIIKIEQLEKSFGDLHVLKGIDLEVNRGAVVCIIGASGSGKSTLLRSLLGLLSPLAGKIDCPAQREGRLGYLPQQTPTQRDFPATVTEVVLSGFSNRRARFFYTAEERSAALMNLGKLGVLELKDKCYRELSGGQQQRVLLARALCATRKLLLLDEPVTGLDPVATGELYNLIKLVNLCNDITVIMVTHDIDAALRYATHVLHLGHQQLFFGTAAAYKQSDAARRFLGGRKL